jgi:hypothetical protein
MEHAGIRGLKFFLLTSCMGAILASQAMTALPAAKILARQVGLTDERIEAPSQSRTILAGFLSSVN